MSKTFNIKPPNWPREFSFQEFRQLNPHIINENQLIILYNQYLNKYLTELKQNKIHFKQSTITQLLTEIQNLKLENIIDLSTPGGTDSRSLVNKYSITFSGDTVGGGITDANKTYMATPFDPDDYNLNLGFTVSFWVRPDLLDFTTGFALGRRPANSERFQFGVYKDGKGFVGVGSAKKNGWLHGMEVGNWYHWVTTYSGNSGGKELKTYINDDLKNDVTATWSSTTAAGNGQDLFLGAENGTSTYTNGWHCGLDEVAIFDEVKDLDSLRVVHNGIEPKDVSKESGLVGYWRFEEGSGTTVEDSSENSNNGTLTTNLTSLPTWSTDVHTNLPK